MTDKITDIVKAEEIEDETSKITKKVLTNRNDDYEYGRELLYSAAERLQDVLESAVELARESEHPRAIEVATNTANALGDVAQKMMGHHLNVEKLNNPNGNQKIDQSTTNNLNVKMNSAQLLELLKNDE